MASAFFPEAAGFLASTAQESAPQDRGVTETDVQQQQPEAARVASYGMLQGKKHIASLRPAALLVLSIAAAIAMIFMLLRCFRALQQADNAAPASRRLAYGGHESSSSCPVSRHYSLSTIMTAVAICAVPRHRFRQSVSCSLSCWLWSVPLYAGCHRCAAAVKASCSCIWPLGG